MRGRRRIKSRALEETKATISSRISKSPFTSKPNPPFDDVLSRRRSIGNRAVQRLFKSGQAKLRIGAPNDVYEQEADRLAEQVMRIPESFVQPKPT